MLLHRAQEVLVARIYPLLHDMQAFEATSHVAQFGITVAQIVQVVGACRLYPVAQVVQDVPLEHV